MQHRHLNKYSTYIITLIFMELLGAVQYDMLISIIIRTIRARSYFDDVFVVCCCGLFLFIAFKEKQLCGKRQKIIGLVESGLLFVTHFYPKSYNFICSFL